MKSSRRLVAASAVLVLAAVYLLRAPLLTQVGRFLVEEDPLAPADAIVVPSGSFPDRILQAVTLYEEGFAPRIVLCRELESKAFKRLRALGIRAPQGYDLNRDVAEQLGVPSEAIIAVDRKPGSTFSEARQVLEHVRAHGYKSILLVTSKYHTRRAARIYRHIAGDSIRVIVRPARLDSFRADAWWKNRASTRRVIIEYEKLLVFFLLDRWRMSPAERNPRPVEDRR